MNLRSLLSRTVILACGALWLVAAAVAAADKPKTDKPAAAPPAPSAKAAPAVKAPEPAKKPEAAKPAEPAKPVEDPNRVVATIDGKPITAQEVENSVVEQQTAAIRQTLRSNPDALGNALKGVLDDKILELEAAKQGVAKDALLEREVKAKIVVGDEDINKFYEENKARIPSTMTKEQVMPQIRSYLSRQKETDAKEGYLTILRAKYAVHDLAAEQKAKEELAKASERRATLEGGDAPAKGGPATAPVKLVEFSDFQCPFCSRVVDTLEQVVKNYGDKVRFTYRQFPLPMHQNARKAAEASLCAKEQGKFWEMYEAMFKDQNKLAVADLKATAKGLGLNSEQFDKCLDESKFGKTVDEEIAMGQKAGVSGTPAMFVNGRFLSGAQPYPEIAKVIDEELAKAGVKPAGAASK